MPIKKKWSLEVQKTIRQINNFENLNFENLKEHIEITVAAEDLRIGQVAEQDSIGRAHGWKTVRAAEQLW